MITSALTVAVTVAASIASAPIPTRYIGQFVPDAWAPPAGFSQKVACITFDDGPKSTVTPQVLQVLSNNNVHATFFMLGSQMAGNSLAAQTFARGHEVGNHTYSHLSNPPTARASFEYLATFYAIMGTSGWDNWIFRPPYGQRTASPTLYAKNRGNAIVLWTNDSHDWELNDPLVIFSRVMGQKRPGDIILMHDNRSATPAAANLIIQAYKADGYRFVNVNEMLWIWDSYLTSQGR